VAALKEHFLKLAITSLFAVTVYAGQSYVNEKHHEAMATINTHATHIHYIKEDLKEIKELLKELVKNGARP
jgi:hypothetical protein